VPHINVGDLLYAEVAGKTPLGLEAQRHMDSSRTVPDKLLMRLLLERLKQQDCQTCGWVLDGFPHTREQVQAAVGCALATTMRSQHPNHHHWPQHTQYAGVVLNALSLMHMSLQYCPASWQQ
jgi:hypothetical protein